MLWFLTNWPDDGGVQRKQSALKNREILLINMQIQIQRKKLQIQRKQIPLQREQQNMYKETKCKYECTKYKYRENVNRDKESKYKYKYNFLFSGWSTMQIYCGFPLPPHTTQTRWKSILIIMIMIILIRIMMIIDRHGWTPTSRTKTELKLQSSRPIMCSHQRRWKRWRW